MGKMYWVWNEEIGNYCAAEGKTENDFVYPLYLLKLSEVDKADLAGDLQMIFYKRTGRINEDIGFSYEKDKKLAQKMKCWD